MKEVKIADYVQTRQPIKAMVTEIINAMKGSERSMADFSVASGVNSSMLSRIINENYSKPISIDVLQKVAACSVDGCPFTLKDLLRANGMLTKEEAAHDSAMQLRRNRFFEQQRRRRDMREIITDELFAREITIKKLGLSEKTEDQQSKLFSGAMICDLAIELPENEKLEWGFSMLSAIREDDVTERDDVYYIRRIIENYAVIFLQDAWEPENAKNIKFSFGFADEVLFNMFIEALEVAKFNNRISAILINVNEHKVMKEFNFPCKNFSDIESLFDLPVQHEEGQAKADFRQIPYYGELHGEND